MEKTISTPSLLRQAFESLLRAGARYLGLKKRRRALSWPDRAPFDPAWGDFLDACEAGVDSPELLAGIEAGLHHVSWREDFKDNPSALHLALRAKDRFALHALIKAGAPLEAVDEERVTPLGRAAERGALEAMEALIKSGASLNPKAGWSPLERAFLGGSVEAIDLLLSLPAVSVRARSAQSAALALAWACQGEAGPSRRACVERALSLGADPNAVVELNGSPLLSACLEGDLGAVEALIAAGADPRGRDPDDGSSAFMRACVNKRKDPRVAALAASLGSSPLWASQRGKSGLMSAAEGGMIECVELALAAGADPLETTIYGQTALHFAADSESPECVERLLAAGAPIDALSLDGRSALWVAAQRHAKTDACFMTLALAGADPLAGEELDKPMDFSFCRSAFVSACDRGWIDGLQAVWVNGLARRRADGMERFLLTLAGERNPEAAAALAALLEREELEKASPPLAPGAPRGSRSSRL